MTQTSISQEETEQSKIRNIGIVAFDGMEVIDLTGPLDVFSLTGYGFQATGMIKENVYPIKVLAK